MVFLRFVFMYNLNAYQATAIDTVECVLLVGSTQHV